MRDIIEAFEGRAASGDVAVIDDDGAHSARRVLEEADRLAGILAKAANGPPTIIAQADNSWRTVAVALAIGRLGGTLALASTHLTAGEFALAAEDVRPDAVVASDTQLAAWRPHTTASLGSALDGWPIVAAPGLDVPDRWQGGVLIGMTSGSTGRAKGVVHAESALSYACTQFQRPAGLERGDPIAAIVPLSSAPAFCFGVYFSLLLGGPLVLSGRWDPAKALTRMAGNDARWLMCVPTQVLQLAAAAKETPGVLGGMRALVVGGGPMAMETLSAAETVLGVPLTRAFGMSECLGHTWSAPGEPPEIRLGRDGRPFPGTEVRIVDEYGAVLPAGEVGRGQVRGPSRFLGYARDGGLSEPPLTEGGFFETGDLIRCEPDGTLQVAGREKDVIIRGGRNVAIAEVEQALLTSSRVAEACVVPVPDAILGERVAVLAVPADRAALSLRDVTAHLEKVGLARTKWPEFVYPVEEIPHTAMGKVARARARDIARERHEQQQAANDLHDTGRPA
jgi:cyclohexanecarboxylate-CoA ligase